MQTHGVMSMPNPMHADEAGRRAHVTGAGRLDQVELRAIIIVHRQQRGCAVWPVTQQSRCRLPGKQFCIEVSLLIVCK